VSCNPLSASLGSAEGRYLDEVGSGAVSDYSSTFSGTPPRAGIKIASHITTAMEC
jgi:hypothetical protein